MGFRPHQRGWGAQVDVSGWVEVGEAPSEAPTGVLSIPPPPPPTPTPTPCMVLHVV